METPNCNFCGSDKSNQTLIYTNVKNTNHNLVECNNCKLRFYSPRRAWSEYLKGGYGNWEGSKKEAEQMFNHANFTRICDKTKQVAILKSYYTHTFINKLFKLVPQLQTVYEIGGSVGWFSYFIKQVNPTIQVDGCEVNRYAVDIAKNEFGLNYTAGSFLESPVVEGKQYDCVVALDYIEHTFTPWDDLQKMASITKPGGILLLKTFLEELDVDRSMEAPIGHSHHFFGDVLKSMIIKSGFRILEWNLELIMVNVIGVKE